MTMLRAAGGVVYRDGEAGTGPEFLVVHRERYHDWSLPKGKLDRGETFEQAAMREIQEETGFNCDRGEYLGATTYKTQPGRPKIVKYWLTKRSNGEFTSNKEVDRAEWVGLHGAQALLTYNRDASLVARAHAILTNPTATRVYLLRHGNAGIRSKGKGPDKQRPLTEKGQQQALGLAEIIARYPVTDIRSSPAERCKQTVSTIAHNTEIEVRTSKLLKEFTDLNGIYKFLGKIGPGSVVVCSHKDWIGPLIKDLDSSRVRLRGSRKWPKASIWVLDLVDGKVQSGFYLGRA
ncbi:MAG: NUDIX hydrolase [Acidimicrobiia bacterium]|nr:NUDIX hydrolase [Acidimicrobiia bacterium]MDX2465855.1 NUDIX hydrolase [Acidimicrobiia bacterium]